MKEFTKSEKKALERRVQAKNIADAQLNDFLAFLREQHGVDNEWQLKQDLFGFEKLDKKNKGGKIR